MRYLIIDTQHLFMRAIHVTKGDPYMRGSLAIHIMLMSIWQSWRTFDADHVVLCLESKTRDNWRKKIDERYKANRALARDAQTPKEKEDGDILFTILNGFLDFVRDKTNMTVLQCPIAEADDLIARFMYLHPNDEHILPSSDKDFYQLLSDNIVQFNGITKTIFSTEDCPLWEDVESRMPYDWKHNVIDDPEFLLFEKIIRGDSGDNVFSAFPGVRMKAAKGKPSISSAYADRHNKGFNWNNFMRSPWTDHHGVNHIVKDTFARNQKLVGLNEHPDDVKDIIDINIIETLLNDRQNTKIGFSFMKFCHNNSLDKMLTHVDHVARILAAKYPIKNLTGE